MGTELDSLLVIEDNPRAGELLAQCFRENRYSVTLCQDGNRALELIAADRFDLVLLDIMLPGADGLAVLQQVRAAHPATTLPVIMTTGLGRSEMVVRALELGANDYVTKPYDIPVLRARVQTHLSIKRMVEQRKRLEENLADAYTRIKEDLRAAARVQETLLPQSAPKVRGAEFAWAFHPCEELAGDTLNVFALDSEHVGLYLLDVSGHGVAAALLAVQLSRVLSPARHLTPHLGVRPLPRPREKPLPVAEVASSLSRLFPFDISTAQFSTLMYGILNCRSGDFRYVSAGHPGPAHVPREGQSRALTGSGLPIGLGEGNYGETVLQLKPGDRLYLYSDGITEATNATNEQFGEERLLAVLDRNRAAPLSESTSAVLADVQAWQAHPRDDVSLLGFEWTGPRGRRPG